MKPNSCLILVLDQLPWTQMLGPPHWYSVPGWSLWTQDSCLAMQKQVWGPLPQIQALGLNQWTQSLGWSTIMQAAGLSTCWPRHHASLPRGSSSILVYRYHLMTHSESLNALTGKGLCLLKQVVKAGRGAYFLKCADSNARPQDYE